jgi:hypothetical protein
MENPGEGCKKGLGKSRGRGEKECRNPGGGVIRDQNPGVSSNEFLGYSREGIYKLNSSGSQFSW